MSTVVGHNLLRKLNHGYHTSHVLTNIFQMIHISAVKFTECLWEKCELSFDAKISEFEKKYVGQAALSFAKTKCR